MSQLVLRWRSRVSIVECGGKPWRDTAAEGWQVFEHLRPLDSGVVDARCPCIFATALHDAVALIEKLKTSASPPPR